jgi:hypothetical protein
LRWAGALVLIGLGGVAFFHNTHAATHFEGFILVIACVLVLQGVLMLATLGRTRGSGARPLDPMTPAR